MLIFKIASIPFEIVILKVVGLEQMKCSTQSRNMMDISNHFIQIEIKRANLNNGFFHKHASKKYEKHILK